MITLIIGKYKGKFIRVHVTMEYSANGGIAPPILSLGTRLSSWLNASAALLLRKKNPGTDGIGGSGRVQIMKNFFIVF